MGQVREEVESKILEKYREKGTITEDEIVDICLDYDLNLIEIDSICERIFSKKVIVSDDYERKNTNDEKEYADHSHTDYEYFYDKVEKEFPNMTAFVEQVRGVQPPQSREWKILLPQAQNGNKYARERMVMMYTRSILRQAYDFAKAYYVDYEGAFQNGMIGLLIAINKFDMTRPDSFVSYFGLWAMQTMRRYSLPQNFICQYPVHFKETIFKAMDDLREETGEETFENLLEYIEIEDLVSAIDTNKKLNNTFSFEELSEDSITTEMSGNSVENIAEQSLLKTSNHELLGHLKDRERKVLCMRYGLADGTEHTLEEVGQSMGVTRERIRQIEKKAIDKLGKALERRKVY